MRFSPCLLVAIAVATLSVLPARADPGHDHSAHDHTAPAAYGRPGDASKGGRVVQIVMSETESGMVFTPNRLEIRRGEQVQFVLRNHGELDHELVIGTVEDNLRHAEAMAQHPDMDHVDPNAKRVGPKATGVLRWQFTEAGTFEYACLIPGHREAGMLGSIVVK